MDEKDKSPRQDLQGNNEQKDFTGASEAEESGTRIDYEATSLDEFNEETDFGDTEEFGNGDPTDEDDIADSGIGSDVDDMVRYQSGQSDLYTKEQ